MQNFQDTFDTCKRSFISAFSSICMTVPLNLNFSSFSIVKKKVDEGFTTETCIEENCYIFFVCS